MSQDSRARVFSAFRPLGIFQSGKTVKSKNPTSCFWTIAYIYCIPREDSQTHHTSFLIFLHSLFTRCNYICNCNRVSAKSENLFPFPTPPSTLPCCTCTTPYPNCIGASQPANRTQPNLPLSSNPAHPLPFIAFVRAFFTLSQSQFHSSILHQYSPSQSQVFDFPCFILKCFFYSVCFWSHGCRLAAVIN